MLELLFSKAVALVATISLVTGLIFGVPVPTYNNQEVVAGDVSIIGETNGDIGVVEGNNSQSKILVDIQRLEERLVEEQAKREILEDKLAEIKSLDKIAKVVEPLKTFTTPSGAIVGEDGGIISMPAPTPTQENKPLTDTEISKLIIPAIVQIKVYSEDSVGFGSGFIIEENGWIITAAHVVKGVDVAKVFVQGGVVAYDASVIGRDDLNDIALLKISASGLKFVVLGDSDNTNVGDKILVYGHPQGLPDKDALAGVVLTTGMLGSRQPTQNFKWLQTDAATKGGNSGGAWVDGSGKVIGVHVSGYGPTIQGYKIDVGLNFAVPINFVKIILSDLKNGIQKKDYIQPSKGTMISIPRSAVNAVINNPSLTCEQLGSIVSPQYLNACQLYKNHSGDYFWNIFED